jgi:monoamine oxidase
MASRRLVSPADSEWYENAFSVAWHRVQYNLGGWAEWDEAGRKNAYPVLLEGEGRVMLAGEHLSHLTGWQAGAIESAWQQIEQLHKRASA